MTRTIDKASAEEKARRLFASGNRHAEAGRLSEAVADYVAALEALPEFPEALFQLGIALGRQQEFANSARALRAAIDLRPDYAEARANLGAALRGLGDFAEAEASLRAALRQNPELVLAGANLGLVLFDQARIREAIDVYDEMLARYPDNLPLWRNRLAAVLYDPLRDEKRHEDLLRRFRDRFAKPLAAGRYANSRDPDRRLRVGYVSADLVNHPVTRNLDPVLEHRDRAGFEVTVYADVARPDAMTERMKGLVDRWQPTVGLTDAQLAEQVRADGIDILVCLANRLDKSRPLIAVQRAAPVQVSFHDPATSGIAEMDYLIADRVLAPRGGPEKFSERVVRLPSFYIHAPLTEAPEVGPLPALKNGHVTFGSFNNPSKISDAVLGLWGEVLRAVPGSRLVLKFKNWFGNSGLRERVLKGLGVDEGRVEFRVGESGAGEHLGLYGGVDIALDPYPFTGSTTTFEALWMGVPVVTLLGEAMAGRWSASMLHALKLDELVGRTGAEYVGIAARLAGDRARLTALRAELRGRVAGSPLCDGRARARQIDRLYRAIWRRWCKAA